MVRSLCKEQDVLSWCHGRFRFCSVPQPAPFCTSHTTACPGSSGWPIKTFTCFVWHGKAVFGSCHHAAPTQGEVFHCGWRMWEGKGELVPRGTERGDPDGLWCRLPSLTTQVGAAHSPGTWSWGTAAPRPCSSCGVLSALHAGEGKGVCSVRSWNFGPVPCFQVASPAVLRNMSMDVNM